MKSSTVLGKNEKFAIVVFTCTRRVLQERLTYSRERSFSFKASDCLQERTNVLRSREVCP